MLLQHPSLLITDDDSSFRETLRFVLERRGYRTLLAADGEEALEILKHADVHLALLDMHMPKLTGLETMRRAKQIYSRLPCILLSARLDDALIQQARMAEAFSVLSKPISRDMLTTTVELAIRRTYEMPDDQGPPPQLPPQRRF